MSNILQENAAEIGLRLILMFLFRYYDKAEPFIRHIQPEEVWLYKYPVTGSYVPCSVLWYICIGFPAFCFIMFYIFDTESRKELGKAFSSLTLAFSLNAFLTSLLKVLVGRPRPDFVARCFPDGKGTDFTKCTGHISEVYDGRRSFPSGHSSFSFVVMAFLSLFFARRLSIWTTKHFQGIKITACIAPIVFATCIAISRTCDYHHHYQDVIVGSLMGASIAYGVFKIHFESSTMLDDTRNKKDFSSSTSH
ncbi:hypothetical protein WA026_010717 [Henosepilachna vigintioctopunctata]|uniref:Phosphatidic acid phosphatase type 2/haloperoxidase domain-containing protein n=1 Tax=Henosepilachna vigintioctopunctata TaxID=420089 RepID=A0AAW1UXG9_9CUCU